MREEKTNKVLIIGDAGTGIVDRIYSKLINRNVEIVSTEHPDWDKYRPHVPEPMEIVPLYQMPPVHIEKPPRAKHHNSKAKKRKPKTKKTHRK